MGTTLLDKIWDSHVVSDLGDGYSLIHIDRHLLHDLSGPGSLRAIQKRGLSVQNPELTFATADHCVSTVSGRTETSTDFGGRLIPVLKERCEAENITYFGLDSDEQGIVHVIGPELGLTLPGVTVVCGDSHTCTHGAFGALAWGIGSSELNHVLATQCVIEKKPKTMRVSFEGSLPTGITAKDMILRVISRYGADLGVGHAVEFDGEAVVSLSMEERMTLCNLAIELGAKIGMIAPDKKTIDYLRGRSFAPVGTGWDDGVAYWQTLFSDLDADFDKTVSIDISTLAPQVSWGISPEHTISIDEFVPDPDLAPDSVIAQSWQQALDYMGLIAGQSLIGLPIQRVFIGSCANSRLSDLEAAAAIARSGQVYPGVVAWVVPGSQRVKREAEMLGLDKVFVQAGFEWREPGCSQCVATNGETVAARERCLSTSNRNFVGRQGPGARTHLASPAMAALAAINGCISHVGDLLIDGGPC